MQILFCSYIWKEELKTFNKNKKVIKRPVSRLAIMTPSPNLALFQTEVDGITPFSSNPINSHEWVVCSFLPLFSNTDNTFGCSTTIFHNNNVSETNKQTKTEKKNRVQGSYHSFTCYLSCYFFFQICSKTIYMSCVGIKYWLFCYIRATINKNSIISISLIKIDDWISSCVTLDI